ncbi:glycoside hydrolase [Zopfochytrium polystomum]|nr:glycoside hydrolase [Zopfochytrium polystomum]
MVLCRPPRRQSLLTLVGLGALLTTVTLLFYPALPPLSSSSTTTTTTTPGSGSGSGSGWNRGGGGGWGAPSGRGHRFKFNPPSRDPTSAARSRYALQPFAPPDVAKQAFIKEMMVHAWNGYMKFANGTDQLSPLTEKGFNWYTTGTLLMTPVDALSTLWIMGLKDEYTAAKAAVLERFRPLPPSLRPRKPAAASSSASSLVSKQSSPDDPLADIGKTVSVFETTIRVLGGMLSAYDLEGDRKLLEAAAGFADRLMPAMNAASDGRMPVNEVDLVTGETRVNYFGISLAQAGSLQLEFQYLADVTGDRTYSEKAMLAHEGITTYPSLVPGLVPNFMDLSLVASQASKDQGFMGNYERKISYQDFGVGSNADSYYEYLLKIWLSTGDKAFLQLYRNAVDAITKTLVKTTNDDKFTFVPDAQVNGDGLVAYSKSTFSHLSCFVGGMYALGAVTSCNHLDEVTVVPRNVSVTGGTSSATGGGKHRPAADAAGTGSAACQARELDTARRIAETCHAAATVEGTVGVGFEEVQVLDGGVGARAGGFGFSSAGGSTVPNSEGSKVESQLRLYSWNYSLRPEVVESIFYMWRMTHDPVWREMGWSIAQNINRHCRHKNGFFNLHDVSLTNVSPSDTQETFFLAETLKYLYLLFSGDDLIPLDEYVFNTEAHPLSIRGHGRRKGIRWGGKA